MGVGVIETTDKQTPSDSGLAALVLLLRFNGVGVNSEQILHRFGGDIGVSEMLRCAKEFGLKARTYQSKWQRLINMPLPGIAVLRDGRCLGSCQGQQGPGSPARSLFTAAHADVAQ